MSALSNTYRTPVHFDSSSDTPCGIPVCRASCVADTADKVTCGKCRRKLGLPPLRPMWGKAPIAADFRETA